MGKQSARIFYQGKDHKDIYMDGYYHSAVYKSEESKDGKIVCKLIWKKIFDENLYIHDHVYTVAGDNAPSGIYHKALTVNMDAKKVFLSKNDYSARILYNPEWTSGKKYAAFTPSVTENCELYLNKELVFNESYKMNFSSHTGSALNNSIYPAIIYVNSSKKTVYIRRAVIENGKVIPNTITVDLKKIVAIDGYKINNFFHGYNNGGYIYIIGYSNESSILIRIDIDGNVKTLRLDDIGSRSSYYNESPKIIAAKGEKVYLFSTKVLKDEDTDSVFVINSITVVDGMQIASTELIDSWSESQIEIVASPGKMSATLYMPTVSPMSFVCERIKNSTNAQNELLITIEENKINSAEIEREAFSFFVNVYEDGEIVDTVTVSTKPECTDIKNGIFSLFDLKAYNVNQGFSVTNSFHSDVGGYKSIVYYSSDGWNEGGTHGTFWDKETQYFYTFYMKYLYPSGENFFIRFKV